MDYTSNSPKLSSFSSSPASPPVSNPHTADTTSASHPAFANQPPSAFYTLTKEETAARDRSNTISLSITPKSSSWEEAVGSTSSSEECHPLPIVEIQPATFLDVVQAYLITYASCYNTRAPILRSYYSGGHATQLACGKEHYPETNDLDYFVFIDGQGLDYRQMALYYCDYALSPLLGYPQLAPEWLLSQYRKCFYIDRQGVAGATYQLPGIDITFFLTFEQGFSDCPYHVRGNSFLIPLEGSKAVSLCGDYTTAVEDVRLKRLFIPLADKISGKGLYAIWRYLTWGWSIASKEQESLLLMRINNACAYDASAIGHYTSDHYCKGSIGPLLYFLNACAHVNAEFRDAKASPLSEALANHLKVLIADKNWDTLCRGIWRTFFNSYTAAITKAPDRGYFLSQWISLLLTLYPEGYIKKASLSSTTFIQESTSLFYQEMDGNRRYRFIAIPDSLDPSKKYFLAFPEVGKLAFTPFYRSYKEEALQPPKEMSGQARLFYMLTRPLGKKEQDQLLSLYNSKASPKDLWQAVLSTLAGSSRGADLGLFDMLASDDDKLGHLWASQLAWHLYQWVADLAKSEGDSIDLLQAQTRLLWLVAITNPRKKGLSIACLLLIGKGSLLGEDPTAAAMLTTLEKLLVTIEGEKAAGIPTFSPRANRIKHLPDYLCGLYLLCLTSSTAQWHEFPKEHFSWMCRKHSPIAQEISFPLISKLSTAIEAKDLVIALWKGSSKDDLSTFITIYPLLIDEDGSLSHLHDLVKTAKELFTKEALSPPSIYVDAAYAVAHDLVVRVAAADDVGLVHAATPLANPALWGWRHELLGFLWDALHSSSSDETNDYTGYFDSSPEAGSAMISFLAMRPLSRSAQEAALRLGLHLSSLYPQALYATLPTLSKTSPLYKEHLKQIGHYAREHLTKTTYPAYYNIVDPITKAKYEQEALLTALLIERLISEEDTEAFLLAYKIAELADSHQLLTHLRPPCLHPLYTLATALSQQKFLPLPLIPIAYTLAIRLKAPSAKVQIETLYLLDRLCLSASLNCREVSDLCHQWLSITLGKSHPHKTAQQRLWEDLLLALDLLPIDYRLKILEVAYTTHRKHLGEQRCREACITFFRAAPSESDALKGYQLTKRHLLLPGRDDIAAITGWLHAITDSIGKGWDILTYTLLDHADTLTGLSVEQENIRRLGWQCWGKQIAARDVINDPALASAITTVIRHPDLSDSEKESCLHLAIKYLLSAPTAQNLSVAAEILKSISSTSLPADVLRSYFTKALLLLLQHEALAVTAWELFSTPSLKACALDHLNYVALLIKNVLKKPNPPINSCLDFLHDNQAAFSGRFSVLGNSYALLISTKSKTPDASFIRAVVDLFRGAILFEGQSYQAKEVSAQLCMTIFLGISYLSNMLQEVPCNDQELDELIVQLEALSITWKDEECNELPLKRSSRVQTAQNLCCRILIGMYDWISSIQASKKVFKESEFLLLSEEKLYTMVRGNEYVSAKHACVGWASLSRHFSNNLYCELGAEVISTASAYYELHPDISTFIDLAYQVLPYFAGVGKKEKRLLEAALQKDLSARLLSCDGQMLESTGGSYFSWMMSHLSQQNKKEKIALGKKILETLLKRGNATSEHAAYFTFSGIEILTPGDTVLHAELIGRFLEWIVKADPKEVDGKTVCNTWNRLNDLRDSFTEGFPESIGKHLPFFFDGATTHVTSEQLPTFVDDYLSPAVRPWVNDFVHLETGWILFHKLLTDVRADSSACGLSYELLMFLLDATIKQEKLDRAQTEMFISNTFLFVRTFSQSLIKLERKQVGQMIGVTVACGLFIHDLKSLVDLHLLWVEGMVVARDQELLASYAQLYEEFLDELAFPAKTTHSLFYTAFCIDLATTRKLGITLLSGLDLLDGNAKRILKKGSLCGLFRIQDIKSKNSDLPLLEEKGITE